MEENSSQETSGSGTRGSMDRATHESFCRAVVEDNTALLPSAVGNLRKEALCRIRKDSDASRVLDQEMSMRLLHLACKHNAVECARLLLEGGSGITAAPVDARDQLMRTPLLVAAETHSARCIQLLLSKNARTDLRVVDGRPLLPLEIALISNRDNDDSQTNDLGISGHKSNCLTQIFVKICGRTISLQKDFYSTSIQELIEVVCHKAKLGFSDMFAFYGGKYLRPDKCIGFYPILKDSTVHVRPRIRAGRPVTYDVQTFDDYMSKYKSNRLHKVNLSNATINSIAKTSSVTFLGNHPAYFIRQIMIYICDKHRNQRSYNGNFTVKDILIVNGSMVDFTADLHGVDFNKETCSSDYAKIYEILVAIFIDDKTPCPMFFDHFLDHLFICPLGESSNSEAHIRFITNHPAISCYMERIRQLTLLDNAINRMDCNERSTLDVLLANVYSWKKVVVNIPAMKAVYEFDPRKNPPKPAVINPDYTPNYMGLLRFARNFFSHADYQLILEMIEAAFAAAFKNFVPKLLLLIAVDKNSSTSLDMLKLLGNQFSEPVLWNQ